jgi:hypothetical protein
MLNDPPRGQFDGIVAIHQQIPQPQREHALEPELHIPLRFAKDANRTFKIVGDGLHVYLP